MVGGLRRHAAPGRMVGEGGSRRRGRRSWLRISVDDRFMVVELHVASQSCEASRKWMSYMV